RQRITSPQKKTLKTMARGKGKRGGGGGRGRGGGRGGGRRMFIENAEELELNNRRQEALDRLRSERRIAAGAMSDEEEEGSGDEESGEEEAGCNAIGGGNEKEEEAESASPLGEIVNPNHVPAAQRNRGTKLKDLKKMGFE
ncbi:unnamed protein product, partial [Heterosigma akashiwo]